MFSGTAEKLWSILQINLREPDKDEGYQRTLSGSRVAALARYLTEGNALPTSLVVTFDDASLLAEDRILRVPNRPDAGWVIDGQHRLAASHKAGGIIELGVVAFVGLSLDRQIQQFVTINREAKGVPTSLYLDLLKHLPQTKTDAERATERAADLGTQVRRDEESAFYGHIVVVTSPKRGELSLNNFARKVGPLVFPNRGRLHTYNAHEQKKIIDNYFHALANVFSKSYDRVDSIFFQTLGFGGVINAFPTVFDLSVKRHHGFRIEDAVRTLQLVKDFDFERWRELGTGNAAEIEAGNNLRQALLDSVSFSTDEEAGSIRI